MESEYKWGRQGEVEERHSARKESIKIIAPGSKLWTDRKRPPASKESHRDIRLFT